MATKGGRGGKKKMKSMLRLKGRKGKKEHLLDVYVVITFLRKKGLKCDRI